MGSRAHAEQATVYSAANGLRYAVTCTACRTSDHPREAHFTPALARVEAERCAAKGDHAGAAMWRWVARNAERRTCS